LLARRDDGSLKAATPPLRRSCATDDVQFAVTRGIS
jgi:hypothetical protein